MNKYRLIMAADADEMERLVIDLVAQEWRLHGGLTVGDSCLYQWMIQIPDQQDELEKILFLSPKAPPNS